MADIGKGLKILHPSMGVVISGKAVIGENCVITGGNVIGGREHLEFGDILIGNNVNLGANAVVLGPVEIGNNAKIAAGSVVSSNIKDNCVAIGVPARGYLFEKKQ